jgi:O-antigen/teichoic acid export membrane protein
MKDLKGKAIRGSVAKVGAQVVNFSLRIGSLMTLARLLEPEDFGLVGMVTAVTGIFSIFKDAGLSTASVQHATITDEQISALFWLNILVGAILGFLSAAIAPVLVVFYEEPRLLWVTIAMATGFILNAAGVQHSALLQRQMRFAALALIDILALAASVIVGISMALGGFGYWALVGMAIANPFAYTALTWLSTSWVPRAQRMQFGMVRSMVRYGGTVTLNSLVVYLAYNAEKVLLGRFWGADALGIYGRAYQLVNIPSESLNHSVGGVAFSAMSRLQHDRDRLKSYFLKGYSVFLALIIPIVIACAIFAEGIIFIFLGPKWMEAAVIFCLLTPTVLAYGLINPFAWLLFSTGEVKRSLKMALVIAPLVIVACVIGLPYGPVGVACGFSAMMTLLIIPMIAWAIHGTNISRSDVIRAASPPLLSGFAAAGIGLAFHVIVSPHMAALPRLLLGCTALLGSYIIVLFYVTGQKAFYSNLLGELRRGSPASEKETGVI